jgi:hypothetical protein
MAVASKTTGPVSLMQRFRALTERVLLEAAQDEMRRTYAEFCAEPARDGGILKIVLKGVFVPVYRWVPWRIRQVFMQRLLMKPVQRWAPVFPTKRNEER